VNEQAVIRKDAVFEAALILQPDYTSVPNRQVLTAACTAYKAKFFYKDDSVEVPGAYDIIYYNAGVEMVYSTTRSLVRATSAVMKLNAALVLDPTWDPNL
jgi:hypothetical protein